MVLKWYQMLGNFFMKMSKWCAAWYGQYHTMLYGTFSNILMLEIKTFSIIIYMKWIKLCVYSLYLLDCGDRLLTLFVRLCVYSLYSSGCGGWGPRHCPPPRCSPRHRCSSPPRTAKWGPSASPARPSRQLGTASSCSDARALSTPQKRLTNITF